MADLELRISCVGGGEASENVSEFNNKNLGRQGLILFGKSVCVWEAKGMFPGMLP